MLSGGGHAAALPYILVVINLLSVAGIAWLGGLLARCAGRHALWGLLLAAYFGLVVSVGRDTSEPLADLCLLGGLLSYRQRRFVLAALLLSYAAAANEPVLVFPLALAVFLVAALVVLRSTTAPAHERVAFAGFVVLELIIASSQFWYSTFGEGRTFIDAYAMAVVLLLASRTIRTRHLACLAVVILLGLVLVARRRILVE